MWKKTIVLVALVAAPAALAAPQPTAVSIAAQPTVITYGSSTALSGAVTPAESVHVSVAAETCQNPPSQVENGAPLEVKSATNGAWSLTVSPQVQTSYQATAKEAQSPVVVVQVRPLVTLIKVRSHTFRVRVTAAMNLSGKVALFQKRTSVGWKTVKSIQLAQIAVDAQSYVSGQTFRSGLRHRTVRVLLAHGQVGNCYLAGISNSIRA
jgi:hypothetical protein